MAALASSAGLVIGISAPANAAPVTTPAPMADMCVKITGEKVKVRKCKSLETDVPGKPERVRGQVTGPQAITVRWKAPSSGNVPTSYTVVAQSDAGTVVACTSKKRTCTAENLTVEKEYSFYVVGSNASGAGPAGVSAGVFLPENASPDGYR